MLLKIIGLFCRISSLLLGSFAKETYNFKKRTNRSHPIGRFCGDAVLFYWEIGLLYRDIVLLYLEIGFFCGEKTSTLVRALKPGSCWQSTQSPSNKDLFSCKRALYFRKRALYLGKEPCGPAIAGKEPNFIAKESYFPVKEPCISAKEPYLHVSVPCISFKRALYNL